MHALDGELWGLRRTFYEEAEELLEDVESLLLELEHSGTDAELLNSIFRAVHSIKGGSAACDHAELTKFAHVYESLLASLRKGELSVDATLLDVLLQSKDVLHALLASAKAGREDSDTARVALAIAAIRGALENSQKMFASERPGVACVDLSTGFVIWDDEQASAYIPPIVSGSTMVPPQLGRSLPPSLMPNAGHESQPASAPRVSSVLQTAAPAGSSVRALAPRLGSPSRRAQASVKPSPRSTSARRGAVTTAAAAHADRSLEGVVVRVGKESFVLPTAYVESFLQPEASAIHEVPARGRVLLSAHGTLSLLCLEDVLGMDAVVSALTERVAVLCRVGSKHVALVVDEVLMQGTLQMKSLEPNLGLVRGVSGAVLHEDRLALVLAPDVILAAASDPSTQSRCGTND